ncbi:MAG: hypothetical protein ACKVOK_15755 [Flavobacteriales bacterium]
MKKFMVCIAMMGIFAIANAQKCSSTDVPTAAKDAFSKSHPGIENVDWNKDGSNYLAKYEIGKYDMSSCYDSTGKLLESKEEISESSLPEAALNYVNANCKADDIKESTKVVDAKGIVTYEVKVKGKHLVFDAYGKLLNSIEH